MKPIWKDLVMAMFMGLILPGILLNLAVRYLEREEEITYVESVFETTSVECVPMSMRLRYEDGTVSSMDMDMYLVGVVLAEMPASFEMEALKAQAVVARTYTQKAYSTGGKHADGSVCTKASCCQAYCTESEYIAKGGTPSDLEKVKKAVADTSGQVLTYEGNLIEATYFSCSGGTTEDAQAVWGTDFPYLRAVSSPGEEHAAYYTDTKTFTAEAFQKALGAELSGEPDSWFGPAEFTAGGGIASMEIGGTAYTGTQLRSLLGLRSTAFSVETGKDTICVTTHGFGHRVGMSQYGADAMAVNGSSYQQILSHYYSGTVLQQYSG